MIDVYSTQTMASEIGQFALILAFTLAVTQGAVVYAGLKRDEPVMLSYGGVASAGQLFFIALAVLCLATARAGDAGHAGSALGDLFATTDGGMLALALLAAAAGVSVGLGGIIADRSRRALMHVGLGVAGLGILGALLLALQPFARATPQSRVTADAAPAIASIALGARHDTPVTAPAKTAERLPAKFELPALRQGDKGIATSDLEGQVVLLNVFASWCPVCKEEHPTLMRLAEKSPVPIYGINWKDKPGDGAKWLDAMKSPYARVGEDASGKTGTEMGVTGVPETYLVDKDGRIRLRHEGPLSEEIWEKTFVPVLTKLKESG